MKKIISNTFICWLCLCQTLAVAGGFSAPPSLTQSIADARYAKLMGLNTQAFSVASAIGAQDAVPLGQIKDGSINAAFASVNLGGTVYLAGAVLMSSLVPTIKGGFGTGATITGTNGTSSFKINIGTSPQAGGQISLPFASHGWNCQVSNLASSFAVGPSSTAAVYYSDLISFGIGNYTATGALVNWAANSVISVQCAAY